MESFRLLFASSDMGCGTNCAVVSSNSCSGLFEFAVVINRVVGCCLTVRFQLDRGRTTATLSDALGNGLTSGQIGSIHFGMCLEGF